MWHPPVLICIWVPAQTTDLRNKLIIDWFELNWQPASWVIGYRTRAKDFVAFEVRSWIHGDFCVWVCCFVRISQNKPLQLIKWSSRVKMRVHIRSCDLDALSLSDWWCNFSTEASFTLLKFENKNEDEVTTITIMIVMMIMVNDITDSYGDAGKGQKWTGSTAKWWWINGNDCRLCSWQSWRRYSFPLLTFFNLLLFCLEGRHQNRSNDETRFHRMKRNFSVVSSKGAVIFKVFFSDPVVCLISSYKQKLPTWHIKMKIWHSHSQAWICCNAQFSLLDARCEHRRFESLCRGSNGRSNSATWWWWWRRWWWRGSSFQTIFQQEDKAKMTLYFAM